MNWVFLSAEGEVVYREEVQEDDFAEGILDWYNENFRHDEDFVEAVKVVEES